MKRVLSIMALCLLAWAPSRAQAGLQIDSLFRGTLVPASKVTESMVSGKKLKPYNLNYFRSIRFKADDKEIAKVVSWLEMDSLFAEDKEMESERGLLTYALLRFAGDRSTNRYIGYQIKETGGNRFVTVVYMTGKASAEDLRVIFKQR